MTDRLQEIRVRVAELQGQSCGPTKRWLIDSLEFVLGELDVFLRREYRKNYEEERRRVWVERKMAKEAGEEIDWLRVTGQLRGKDDRS